MGMLGNLIKIGVATKVVSVVRREASKPENQQKAMAAFNKIKTRAAGKGSAGA
jgi:hypothetical protein